MSSLYVPNLVPTVHFNPTFTAMAPSYGNPRIRRMVDDSRFLARENKDIPRTRAYDSKNYEIEADP